MISCISEENPAIMLPGDIYRHRSILYISNHIVAAKATPKQSQKSPELIEVSWKRLRKTGTRCNKRRKTTETIMIMGARVFL